MRVGNGTDYARRGRMPFDERSQEAACVPAFLLTLSYNFNGVKKATATEYNINTLKS